MSIFFKLLNNKFPQPRDGQGSCGKRKSGEHRIQPKIQLCLNNWETQVIDWNINNINYNNI